MNFYRNTIFAVVFLLLAGVSFEAAAQFVQPKPGGSQFSSVAQTVGITNITVEYHRPAAKKRTIWGGVIPFNEGKPFPWRAGANENTVITFTNDVKVEGKSLKAGTYGLHVIAAEKEATIIFSRNSSSWGSFRYTPDEDALRVSVKPTETQDHEEFLRYGFDDVSYTGATVYIQWDKTRLPFKVEIENPHDIVLESFRNQFRSVGGFYHQNIAAAVQYCLQNNINHEEALQWADRAIGGGGGAGPMFLKSQLLIKAGKEKEAREIAEQALPTANAGQLNQYGYTLLGLGDTKGAIKVFKLNVEKNPDHRFIWGFYDSLGEGYLKDGDKKNALKYYRVALQKAPENQHSYLNGVISKIEKGE